MMTVQLIFWGALELGMSRSLATLGPFEYTDESGDCIDQDSFGRCFVEFEIENEIKSPHLYLELNDFYTSH